MPINNFGISYSDRFTHLWDITQGIEIGRLVKHMSHAHFFIDSKYVVVGGSIHGFSLYELALVSEVQTDIKAADHSGV